ncbi:hypothetical protein WJX72_004790 [[Myrmecia] bisecta]|uniref:Uncharacterized protein n=1 Tax=[Myrmecia] bisecta TaxID=41462 RepID=A0AAW1R6M3_9CHLO
MLQAVPFSYPKTGFLDPKDPCHRIDKKLYVSNYKRTFAPIEDQPIQFREDGMSITARRLPGKPLMAPKLPHQADLGIGRRRAAQQQKSTIVIGNPHQKNPTHYLTVSHLFHSKPPHMLIPANPAITAEASRHMHHKLGLQ